MTRTCFPRHAARAAFAALLLAVSTTAAFAEHRARLSADLASHLAAGSPVIDVIVDGDGPTVAIIAARYNLVIARRMKSGAVLRVNAGQLDALQRDADITHLSGDLLIRSSMAITNKSIGADQVWAGGGHVPPLTGAGVAVAVVDSGIDQTHQALRGRVVTTVDFTGGNGVDRFGHGTHVAGIIAGQAGRTNDTREIQGVAAGAFLVSLRVLDDEGAGRVSSVIEAIDWAIDHRQQYGIGIINLSLGAPVLQPYRDDPLCAAAERAVAAGIVVVASAGNQGKTADGQLAFGGITSPGNDPYVLTVGAVDAHGTVTPADDTVASYSSRGPTRYDLVIKPDVVAPGSHIVSAEARDSYVSKALSERHVTGVASSAYIQLSGTSMSAGVVSGTVALLLQANGRLTPAEVKAIARRTSTAMPAAGLLVAGSGSVNALAAVQWASSVADNALTVGTTDASASRADWIANLTIVWGQIRTIVWGQDHTIVWGQVEPTASNQAEVVFSDE